MNGRSPGECGLAAFLFLFTRLRFHVKPGETDGLVAEIRSEVRWAARMARENSLT